MNDDQIIALLQSAGAAQQRGDLPAAATHLQAALAIQPNNPQVLNSLGMLALAQQDFQAAAVHFANAAGADTESAALLVNLATAKRGSGDDEGERDALFKALKIDQLHLTANLRLAELHERLDEKGYAMPRWAAVAAIAQSVPDRNPAIEELIATAKTYLQQHGAAYGALVEAELDDARKDLTQTDRRRFDACLDTALGRRRIYTNDCAGIHFPFLPADEFFDKSHFPWLADIEARTEAISQEFLALWEKPEGFQPYVTMDGGVPENKWSALDHSLDWSAYFLWRHGVRNDEACERCPETAKAVESLPICNIPDRSPTVFFSILKPNTRLPAHTGVTNVRAIVHLPLIIPESCGFRVGGEVREWVKGEAFAFDDTIDHEAWNESDKPRAILIFDVWNPHLTDTEKTLLQSFFEISAASSYNVGSTID